MTKLAINGFGRIGRTLLRTILQNPLSAKKIKVSAINIGPADPKFTDHMFKYDTIMGEYPDEVYMENNSLVIGKHKIKIIAEIDPLKINWPKLDVEIIAECTGKFTDATKAASHLKAGAKYVVISAPAKNEDINIVIGVNDKDFNPEKHKIISLGSCTTNAFITTVKVIHDAFTITSGFMTTIHAYTNSQVLLDVEAKDLRRARAAALNIIPTTTGAAKMLGKIIPELDTLMNAMAIRVPVSIVSLIDLSFTTKKEISNDIINKAFDNASNGYMKDIVGFTTKPLVSSDFKGNNHSVIIDSLLTTTAGKIGKVFGWYDNEWGYSCRLRDFIMKLE